MNAPAHLATLTSTSPTQEPVEVTCCRCGDALEPDIIFGGLRYYVCRPCGQWAVPHPPIGTRSA